RPAQVEVVVIERQRSLDLRQIDASLLLVVAPEHCVLLRSAESTVNLQQATRTLHQLAQLGLERQIGKRPRALEEMHAPALTQRHLFTQHRQQRRDADAGADQYQRPVTVAVQGEAAQ